MNPTIVSILVLSLSTLASCQLPPVPMNVLDATGLDPATADTETICKGLPATGAPELIPMTKSPSQSACAGKV